MPTFKEPKLISLGPELTFYEIWSHGIFFHWKTLPHLEECEVLWGNVLVLVGHWQDMKLFGMFPALLPPHPSDASLGAALS